MTDTINTSGVVSYSVRAQALLEESLTECLADARSVSTRGGMEAVRQKLGVLMARMDDKIANWPADQTSSNPVKGLLDLRAVKQYNILAYSKFGVPMIELMTAHPHVAGYTTSLEIVIAASSYKGYSQIKTQLDALFEARGRRLRYRPDIQGAELNDFILKRDIDCAALQEDLYRLLQDLCVEGKVLLCPIHEVQAICTAYSKMIEVSDIPLSAAMAGSLSEEAKFALKLSCVDTEHGKLRVPFTWPLWHLQSETEAYASRWANFLPERHVAVFDLLDVDPEVLNLIRKHAAM